MSEPIDWKKKFIATGITVCVMWVAWVSASIPTLMEAQAVSSTYDKRDTDTYNHVRNLQTQVHLMDYKLNLLLSSNGIEIPHPPDQGAEQ